MRKKNSLTLIELLLVIALIALLVTVTSFGVSKLVFSEHFEKDAHRFKNILALAETLMCTDQVDVSIQCMTTPDGLACYLTSPLYCQNTNLKHIQGLYFNCASTPFTLTFHSSLLQSPRGILEIKGEKTSCFLQLPGYPGGLSFTRSPQPLGVEHAAPYPQALLSPA